MAYTVTVNLHHPEIIAFLYAPGSPMRRNVRVLGEKVARVGARRAPRDTGRLAASVHVLDVGIRAPGKIYADVGSRVNYALWRHEGTGIYAGRGRIRPKHAKVMRFHPGRPMGPLRQGQSYPPRAQRGIVYARSVKGMPGSPYLVSALTDVIGGHGRVRRYSARTRGRR